ncbi:HNH endonuclease [Actinokineospora iranica]|uniref:HNH endonuclease n=1 Tax=Actinokineospora iranica TaxID=1271860 RepID=A0A1G6VW35_9PSEU|nr:HNH endonuclease signature motif containing protein [Actinokineospora iranica]SDD57768.1 hypothetical protein SAMN05216174_113127 [Actinokineospora iranica]
MGISEKSRKLLWGRSGNRCALCRRVLVADRTDTDAEAVVGDEAHIAARSPGGPRHGECDSDQVDDYTNLVLLCRVDHKKVDDQPNHYTTEVLRKTKNDHEQWVNDNLDKKATQVHTTLKNSGIVDLSPSETGDAAWNVIDGAWEFLFQDLDETSKTMTTSTAQRSSSPTPETGAKSPRTSTPMA